MAKNIILGPDLTLTALASYSFPTKFPEFSSIADRLKESRSSARASGCHTCHRTRQRFSGHSEFISIVRSLPKDRLAALKKHFGADGLVITGSFDGKVSSLIL